jgi:hypothetical protein
MTLAVRLHTTALDLLGFSPLFAVLVLLGFFAAGGVVGVLGMVPRWWHQRRLAKKAMLVSNENPISVKPISAPPAPDIPYGP